MRPPALAVCALLALCAAAQAQIVPLSRCHAAIPCSIPFGLRPADAAALSPYAATGQGNTAVAVGAGIEEGLKPRVLRPAASEDPVESAARLYVKRNPPKPTPTPGPK